MTPLGCSFGTAVFRKDKDGNYGTALLAIHPDERARLESGTSGVSISERSTGTSQYSQR